MEEHYLQIIDDGVICLDCPEDYKVKVDVSNDRTHLKFDENGLEIKTNDASLEINDQGVKADGEDVKVNIDEDGIEITTEDN